MVEDQMLTDGANRLRGAVGRRHFFCTLFYDLRALLKIHTERER
jgi:hypothetical protein